MLRTMLRLEGVIFFLLGLIVYLQLGGNLWFFILFLLLPDLSMAGYLKDKRLGALLYNLVHNYVTCAVLFVLGLAFGSNVLGLAGVVLFCHVGMDRALGFGLKYPTNFKDTHLQKI